MTPEELKNFRPHTEIEMDRLMAENFRQRREDEEEVRRHTAAESSALLRPFINAGAAAQDEDASQSTTSSPTQEFPRWVVAAMELEMRSSEETSPGAQLGQVDATTDRPKCLSAKHPPIPVLSHPEVTATSTDPVACVGRLVAVVPEAKLDTAPSGLERFPVVYLADVPAVDGPAHQLAVLCRELQAHKDYLAVRARYCQLSIRMNVQGAMAPAFRSRPRGEGALGDPLHMLLHRDQLVIDYHWCHTKRMLLSPTDADHAHLLDLESAFDFSAAWLLTGKKQKRAYRAAEALCLTPRQQCQTMTLHSNELAQRLGQIQGVYRRSKGLAHSPLAKATTAIGQWVERKQRIKAEKLSYERLWLAQAMLGADGTDQAIAELHSLMLGVSPLHRKTIGGKLKTLNRNVDVVLKPTSTP